MYENDLRRRSLKQSQIKESSYEIVPKKTKLNAKASDLGSSNRYSNVYAQETRQSRAYIESNRYQLQGANIAESEYEKPGIKFSNVQQVNIREFIQKDSGYGDRESNMRGYEAKGSKHVVSNVDTMLDQILKMNRQKYSDNTSEVSLTNKDSKVEEIQTKVAVVQPTLYPKELKPPSTVYNAPININNYMSNPHYIQDIGSLESSQLQDIYAKINRPESKTESKSGNFISKDTGQDSIAQKYTTNNSMNKFSKKLYDELNQYTDSKLQNLSDNLSMSHYKAQEDDKSKASLFDILKQKNMISSPRTLNENKISNYKTNVNRQEDKSIANTGLTEHNKVSTWQRNLIEIFQNMEKAKKHDDSNIEDVNDILKDIYLEKEVPKPVVVRDSFKERVDDIDDLLAKLQNSCDEIEVSPFMERGTGGLQFFNDESSITPNKDLREFEARQKGSQRYMPLSSNFHENVLEKERKLSINKHVSDSQFPGSRKKTVLIELTINNCPIPIFQTDNVDAIVQRFFEKRKIKPTRSKYDTLARLIVHSVNKEVDLIEKRIRHQQKLAANGKNQVKHHEKVSQDAYLKKNKKQSPERSKSPFKKQDYGVQYEKKQVLMRQTDNKSNRNLRPVTKTASQISRTSDLSTEKIRKEPFEIPKLEKPSGKPGNRYELGEKKLLIKQSEIVDLDQDFRALKTYKQENPVSDSERNSSEGKTAKQLIDIEITVKDNPYDLAFKIIQDQGLNFVHYNRIVDKIKEIQQNIPK